MTFTETIAEGVLVDSLEVIRDEIAHDLSVCESMRDKAALYLRLADVMERLEAAKPEPVRGDAVDEIAARRAARRSGTAEGSARAKRPS